MYHAIVFLPLIGALIAGFGGRAIGAKASEYVTTLFLIVAALLSWVAFFTVAMGDGEMVRVPIMRWMDSGGFSVDWALRIDTLTAVMLVVVNTVSALVHVYSIGYMHHDPHRPRFFAYLSFFTFAMLMLVTSDNLLQMFFGWEGVGVASYLLIGFWYKKPSANAAAMKAFIVNRVGDFGFAARHLRLFVLFGSSEFDAIFRPPDYLPAEGAEGGETVPVRHASRQGPCPDRCLPAAVHGRDGQVGAVPAAHLAAGRHGRPDAGVGADPCRDHGDGGVFLVARMSPVFEHAPDALTVVTWIGAITAFFAATVGLVQNDIKRVIAYSTCSQLGYMFVALGIGAYGVAIFHLFTHAFFKALLFLGAGSVIHAVSDEQDMRAWAACARRSR
jgi:NADH-quinone oxidoreductase subunit L